MNIADDKQMAELTAQLMRRVQLTGEEVAAFNAVMSWLQSKAVPTPLDREVDNGSDNMPGG